MFETEYENQFKDYRNEDVEEKERKHQQNLSELPIQQLIRQSKLNEPLWDYDCVSLYPSAMWDKASIYTKLQTGYAYTPDMNDELVEKFNNQTFTQGSVIMKIK